MVKTFKHRLKGCIKLGGKCNARNSFPRRIRYIEHYNDPFTFSLSLSPIPPRPTPPPTLSTMRDGELGAIGAESTRGNSCSRIRCTAIKSDKPEVREIFSR